MIELIFLYLLLVISYFPTKGFFSYQGIFLLGLVFIILFSFFTKYKVNMLKKTNPDVIYYLLVFLLFLFLGFELFFDQGIYVKNATFVLVQKTNFFIAFLIALFYLKSPIFDKNSFINKYKFYLLLLIAFVNRLLMLVSSPEPAIDVFYILKEAPNYLMKLQNPYMAIFTQVYPGFTSNYYAYWPGSFLIASPFSLIFSDPRYLFIVADLITAFLFIKISPKFGSLLALIFLYQPFSLFILEQSWLNPINFLLISALVYSLLNKKQPRFQGVILGLMFSIQFHLGLILFPLLKLTRNLKVIKYFILTSLVLIFPFFLWSPNDFIYDTIVTWIKRPSIVPIPFLNSLNLNALYVRLTASEITPSIRAFAILATYLFILIKQKRTIFSFLLALVLTYFSLNLLGTQAFLNYYYFVGSLMILAMAVLVNNNYNNL